MEKKFKTTLTKEVVEKRIKKYMGDTEYEAQVSMVGRLADVTLAYTDFKPVRKVRRDLERMLPSADITRIDRIFSEQTYLMVLDELMSQDRQIYVKEADGTIKKTSFLTIFEEELYYRTID